MLIEEGVEQNDRAKILIQSFDDDVSEILVLIGKEPQYFFQRHAQRGLEQQHQKL